MTTATLGNTTVQLEGLINGYSEVLEQAKDQLTSFDLSEHHLDRIAVKVAANSDLQKEVKKDAMRQIADLLVNEPEGLNDDYVGRAFIKVIADKITADLQSQIETLVNECFDKVLTSDAIEKRLMEKVAATAPIDKALTIAGHMQAVAEQLKADEAA